MPNPNLSNPEKLVNEARLNEYHQTILPYLGGHIECGFTPVGAVIMMSGNEAPKHYLKCDGTVYNIADYPELAAFYARSQGSCNFYGGNGTTTFAVPDLRGEFLRGTGTNSHENQGSGADVGVHQDGTRTPRLRVLGDDSFRWEHENTVEPPSDNFDYDGKSSPTTMCSISSSNKYAFTTERITYYTSRPTNTSVLFCVASKNIYLDARFDYSLEEKVVGEWIDGKPIYQKTWEIPNSLNITCRNTIQQYQLFELGDIDKIISSKGIMTFWNLPYIIPYTSINSSLTVDIGFRPINSDGTPKYVLSTYRSDSTVADITNVYVTLQYTKTTDA